MRYKKFLWALLLLVVLTGIIGGISLVLQPGQSMLGISIIIGSSLLGAAGIVGGLNDGYDLIGKFQQENDAEIQVLKPEQSKLDQQKVDLESKWKFLSDNMPDCPFVLIGSVYLDIILRPIDTTKLDQDEWNDIDPLQFDLGGSSIWVGRYLHKIHKRQSYIFSVQGSRDDPLNTLFSELLRKEPWPLNSIYKADNQNSQTAVTVHLIQRNNIFKTMFTHRGALNDFDWDPLYHHGELLNVLAKGGVLYLSGYLKTNLCKKLLESLKRLPPNIIVAIDHGQLVPNKTNPVPLVTLKEAFDAGLIDIYICTFRELWNFCHYDKPDSKLPINIKTQELEHLAIENNLPYITIVRGEDVPSKTNVFVIFGGKVQRIEGKPGRDIIAGSVGLKNAFTASFLYNLVNKDDTTPTLDERVKRAAKKALHDWHVQR